jgi:hypothetical protein
VLKTVSFEIDRLERTNAVTVTPYVDGASLAALVEAYERAKGYSPAGGYGGLVPAYFNCGPLDEYLIGKHKSDYWMRLKGIPLLGCTCGEIGCRPFIASVYQKDDTIRWDGFARPRRRERDYSKFGPFTFSRAQYEDAVNDLLIRLS